MYINLENTLIGNFVSDFAKANGMKLFQLAILINNKPGGFRYYPPDSTMRPLNDSTSVESWTIVDLRPMRDYVHAGMVKANMDIRQLIFACDAVMMPGGAAPAALARTGNLCRAITLLLI